MKQKGRDRATLMLINQILKNKLKIEKRLLRIKYKKVSFINKVRKKAPHFKVRV